MRFHLLGGEATGTDPAGVAAKRRNEFQGKFVIRRKRRDLGTEFVGCVLPEADGEKLAGDL